MRSSRDPETDDSTVVILRYPDGSTATIHYLANASALLPKERFEVSADGRTSEVVAHGFRNPYDLAFNGRGDLFTVDADGERDQYLPWYAPTRLFDVAPGMHHGWVLKGWQRSWNRPASYLDNVDRLVAGGRECPRVNFGYWVRPRMPSYA